MKKPILRIKAGVQIDPLRLLIVAACLHLAVTTSVFIIGRLSLIPSQFDRDGLGDFAPDGRMHLSDAVELTQKLGSEGIVTWLSATAPLHVRVYSLSLALLGRLIGFNILSIEPINLAYYLAILAMVYKLTAAMFDRRAALLAATIVALWPTLLIHSTQPLRDPLLITLVLALFLIVRRLLTRTFSWRQTINAAVAGAVVLLMIWIVRLAMWDIMRVVIGLTFVLLVICQVKEKRVLIGNSIAAATLVAALFLIPLCNPMLQFLEKRDADMLIGEKVFNLPLWDRIYARRDKFISIRDAPDYQAGSDIDSNVRFRNKADVVRYLPRAAAIGLFAPFPNIWFKEGLLVGRTGRWVSGAEMLLTYVLEALAVIVLWQNRRELFVWLLMLSAILGGIALALIVINLGSLYRLRYAFWILFVILGAGGARHLVSRIVDRKPMPKAETA